MGAIATACDYGAGERIVRQGEPDEGIYIVQSGRVMLAARRRSGREEEVAHLIAGDVFGEMALLPGEPSPVSAIVTADAHVLLITDEMIVQLVGESNLFAREMNLFLEERKRTLYAFLNTDRQGQAAEKAFTSAFAVSGGEDADTF